MSGRTRRGNMGPSLSRPDQRQATEMAVESDPNEVLPGLENTMRAMGIIDKLGPLLEPVKQEIAALRDSASREASRKELEAVKSERDELHRQLTKVEQKLNKYIESQTEDSQTIDNLKEQVRRQKGDMQNLALSLELQKKETEDKLKENARLQDELSKNKSRLSRMMGQKLTDNNPDIADLSDANRPTKIAEKYKELYDNEYTDAYEEVVNVIKDEKEVASALQGVLKEARNYCKQIAEEQTKHILEAVQKSMKGSRSTSYLSQTEDSSDLKKHVKDFRKNIADCVFDVICQNFVQGANMNYKLNRQLRSIINDPKVEPFVKQCVHLCWLMVAQDPPVVIGEDPKYGDTFDTNVYKAYTQTGPYVEYVVWPPLYLHDDGPLLAKGVAQAYGDQKESSSDKRGSRRQAKVTSAADLLGGGLSSKDSDRHPVINAWYSEGDKVTVVNKGKDNIVNESVPPITEPTDQSPFGHSETTMAYDINKASQAKNKNLQGASSVYQGKMTERPYQQDMSKSYNSYTDFQRHTTVDETGNQTASQLYSNVYQHRQGTETGAVTYVTEQDLQFFNYLMLRYGPEQARHQMGDEKFSACYRIVYKQPYPYLGQPFR